MKENLIDYINSKLKAIEELWCISDNDWKKLPESQKKAYYAKETEYLSKISIAVKDSFDSGKYFTICEEYGNLKSKELDLVLNICNENIQIERGTFGTQEYKYHIIEFNPNKFKENLFEFFEKTINWYIKNDGICE
jgi:hypothetical protein